MSCRIKFDDEKSMPNYSYFSYDPAWLEPLKNEVTIEEEGDA